MADPDPALISSPDPIPSAEPIPSDEPPQPAPAARRPKGWTNDLGQAERDKLILDNRGLARYLAKWAARNDEFADKDDLFGEAMLLLAESARKWDPDAGTAFCDFVGNYLRRRLGGRVLDDFKRHGARRTRGKDLAAVADYRANHVRGAAEMVADADDGPTVSPDAAAAFARTALRVGWPAELATLESGHRELTLLVVADGLTLDQAAARLGWPAKLAYPVLTAVLRRLAARGFVPADLAARYGLDAGRLARAGDPVTAAADREARRAAVAVAGGDADPRELARRLGVSHEAVIRDRQRLKLRRSPRPKAVRGGRTAQANRLRAAAERDAKIVAAVAGEQSRADVAAAFGVSRNTVGRALAAARSRPVAPTPNPPLSAD